MNVTTIATVMVLIATCQCNPTTDQIVTFEGDCSDATCGYRAAAGTVTRATTLVEGEHGLELGSGSVAVRDEPTPWHGTTAQFVAWCEDPGAMELEVEVDGERVFSGTFQITSNWATQSAQLPTADPMLSHVTRVTFHNATNGRCLLDNIAIATDAQTCQVSE